MRLDEAVNNIRGEKGTIVVLTVARVDAEDFIDVSITRDTIKVKSVTWEMLDDDIAYIQMRNFNTDTARSFKTIQREIIVKNPKSVIFDLRNNSGGFLQTSIDVASAWIDNKLVVSERSNSGSKTYMTAEKPLFLDLPTVVLVNGGSASASEIVAGALQDYELGYIIGEQTFGKGSVQVLEDLPDGSSVKFTIAKWFTPEGRSIDEEGVTPDEEIELTEENFGADVDPQLDRAIQYLKSL
jgi:carboxyl-terminal processing protease